MENLKKITDRVITIHHDIDNVLRDFHSSAEKLFYEKYPEYKQYQVSPDKVRGWALGDEFWPLYKAKEIDDLMMKLFFGGELTYEVFRNAPALVTPDQWKNHIRILKIAFPNCRIIVSTHQYTMKSKLATIEWLDENKITYEDLIFTSEKDLYGADYLLDDKPQTIETFYRNGNGSVGVLLKRERGNGWYRRDNKDIKFIMVNTIDEYRKVILLQESLKKIYDIF